MTLIGAGGAGKTRLAVEIAARIAPEYADGVWYVDLAPITDPDLVPVAVARALGLPDQPGRSTMDTLLRFVRDRRMLVVLDNVLSCVAGSVSFSHFIPARFIALSEALRAVAHRR